MNHLPVDSTGYCFMDESIDYLFSDDRHSCQIIICTDDNNGKVLIQKIYHDVQHVSKHNLCHDTNHDQHITHTL